jgi:ankyrin repeat protein
MACGIPTVLPDDVNTTKGYHQNTILMAAAGAGFDHVVTQLLAIGGVDVGATGKNDKTALMFAYVCTQPLHRSRQCKY